MKLDIEVDIVNPGAESKRTNQYVLKPLLIGTTDFGLFEEGNCVYYKFSIDDKTWETLLFLLKL